MSQVNNLTTENYQINSVRVAIDGNSAIPAIDKRWAQGRIFTNYVSLLTTGLNVKVGAEMEEWHYRAECFSIDMEYLLKCPDNVFWSTMIYQKSALAAIVQFLQFATPFYIDLSKKSVGKDIISLYETCLSKAVKIICRLITKKENENLGVNKEEMGELLYKNYLVSVPMLFDLVIALGNADQHNAEVLHKIFAELLSFKQNYKEDIMESLSYFHSAFRSIQTQAENEGFEGAGGGDPDENLETPYDDVALYTLDCAYSLSVLLDVCPELCALCNDAKLGQSIARFYDNTIPFLYKNIYFINSNAVALSWLNQARLQFLKAFRSISYYYIESALSSPVSSHDSAENFIALLTECLSEQTFVLDYERAFPVDVDMVILKQTFKDLDDFKAKFVAKAYRKEAESEAFRTIEYIASLRTKKSTEKNIFPLSKYTAEKKHIKEDVTEIDNETIDQKVVAVLDVLPYLGTGFIRKLLSRYDNSEDVISAILENNLPPDLINADQTEVYIPEDPQDKLYKQTGSKHFNIFDGDKYDILTNDNPVCIIKQGKGFPNTPQNAAQLLDDKSDLKDMRHHFENYNLVSDDEEHYNKDCGREYDDEYDDSYEALLDSETRVVKSKELRAILANVKDVSDEEDDVSNESEDLSDSESKVNPKQQEIHNNRMPFCENPEDIRARNEARRQNKWAKKGVNINATEKSGVSGVPKGQGQDKETVRNRNRKEVHKSQRANHNRKMGAAYKRSKGMM